MPIVQLDREFLPRFIPYYVLTFWVFEEVARGYGRTLLTEQYNMMRFAVFITATFGFFLRKLRFVVTPKKMGEQDATRQALWPQYLVLGPQRRGDSGRTGAVLAGRGLPTGALVGERDVGVADLRHCGVRRSATRCGSSVVATPRVPVPAAGAAARQVGQGRD